MVFVRAIYFSAIILLPAIVFHGVFVKSHTCTEVTQMSRYHTNRRTDEQGIENADIEVEAGTEITDGEDG